MSADLDLPDLVQLVESQVGDGDELALLDAAIKLSRDAQAVADQLLDHFVRRARAANLSWTAIGERLGVSKQAARARFVESTHLRVVDESNVGLAPRLTACLRRAGEEARADGSAEVGTHHLLLGLMEEGTAAAALERLGVRAAAIRQASAALFGAQGAPGDGVPPYSLEARNALDGARHMAHEYSADEVTGTQHLLCLLANDPGGKARRVLNELGVDVAAVEREIVGPITGRGKKRRRRHGGTGEPQCSFCGRPQSVAGPLVAGTGCHICGDCVASASDVLPAPATVSNRAALG